MLHLLRLTLRLLFRICSRCLGWFLQGVGLLTLLLAASRPQAVRRHLAPLLTPHLRSAELVYRELHARWSPPPPLQDAPAINWPVSTRRVSSGFGVRVNPVTGRRHTHRGIDLPVPIGTPVRASRSAVVVKAREDGLNGKYVVLRDGKGGLRFAYCHLSQIDVKEGQRIEVGSILGRSGNTGRSTGPHLHFGAWFHDRAVDPRRLARL